MVIQSLPTTDKRIPMALVDIENSFVCETLLYV